MTLTNTLSGTAVKTPPTYAGKPMSETSQDKFHDGAFEVLQPTGSAHRSGLDALLLAASLEKGARGVLADLGAGAGVAGFAAVNLYPDLELLSIELNSDISELATRSKALPGNARIADRIRILQADVTKTGTERLEQGLDDNSVDHAIMNPPYNTVNHRVPENALKAEAHMMGEGGVDAWFRTAAAIIRPGGTLCMIYRAENIASILACSQGRFGGLEILPIHSKANEAAKRVLVRGIRGSRAALSIAPGFIVHEENGDFTKRANAIFRGEALLSFT